MAISLAGAYVFLALWSTATCSKKFQSSDAQSLNCSIDNAKDASEYAMESASSGIRKKRKKLKKKGMRPVDCKSLFNDQEGKSYISSACMSWLTVYASKLAYNTPKERKKKAKVFNDRMAQAEWKSVRDFNSKGGADFAEVWVNKNGAGTECMIAFRGTDDFADAVDDFLVRHTRSVAGVDNVSYGLANEFDNNGGEWYKPWTYYRNGGIHEDHGLVDEIQDGHFTLLKTCTTIVSTGYSLGGALASLFAAVANKADSKLNQRITVDYLYTYGAIPIATVPLENDQSPTKCFKGVRYVSTDVEERAWPATRQLIGDFGPWVGSPGGGSYGMGVTDGWFSKREYRLQEGLLLHPKLNLHTIDMAGTRREPLEVMDCTEGPTHPTGSENRYGRLDLHKLTPKRGKRSYLTAIEMLFDFDHAL